MQGESKRRQASAQDLSFNKSDLSAVWQELLGKDNNPLSGGPVVSSEETTIPTLEVDPWSTLVQAKGTEVVDLQTLHLSMSDQEVEQVLQVIQEQPGRDRSAKKDTSLPD